MATNNPAIALRPMTLADISFGLTLSLAAGWNQTAADWEVILSQPGTAGFLASLNGVPAGTVTAIPYQDHFSWVGMALVSGEFQRHGIGTALLHTAIEAGKMCGLVRLDATPAGKQLYDRLGFRDEYGLSRLRRAAQSGQPQERLIRDQDLKSTCQPITSALFAGVLQVDQPVFGADRRGILKELLRLAPQFAYVWAESGIIKGYCLGRIGARYAHIGPIIAGDIHTAQALLLRALRECGQQDVILDAPQQNPEWIDLLSALGFSELRPFIRMCFGDQDPPEPSHKQFAIAGPELG